MHRLDLLIRGAKVWTGEAGSPYAEAVAICGTDITWVGSNHDADDLVSASRRVIDAEGRLVTPGLIDNHVHFTMGGIASVQLDLRDTNSESEFLSKIAAFASSVPAGDWLLGGDWDHQRWSPARLPTRHGVDSVTSGHPLMVTRLDLHMGLANSRALELAGIMRGTEDPPGGEIERDADGEPTGIVKDAAMELVRRVIPPTSHFARKDAAVSAMAHAARAGITSVCDMSSAAAWEDFRVYQELDREGSLRTRISLFVPLLSWRRMASAGVERGFGGSRLKIGGLKGFSDGSLGSGTAWFDEPYLDGCGCGLAMPEVADGSMLEAVTEAAESGLQVAIHAIGNQANRAVLAMFEANQEHSHTRYRIEHAQHLSRELIDQFSRTGVVASMQPAHAIDDGRWAERKIGGEALRWAYPIRSLLDAGARVTFGSDWPVAPLSPILGIHAAVTRRTTDGAFPDGWLREQKISAEEALRCYTTSNAWAMHAEKEIGRIAPGMRGDLAIFSRDFLTIPPEEIESAEVDATIFDGKVVYEGSELKLKKE